MQNLFAPQSGFQTGCFFFCKCDEFRNIFNTSATAILPVIEPRESAIFLGQVIAVRPN